MLDEDKVVKTVLAAANNSDGIFRNAISGLFTRGSSARIATHYIWPYLDKSMETEFAASHVITLWCRLIRRTGLSPSDAVEVMQDYAGAGLALDIKPLQMVEFGKLVGVMANGCAVERNVSRQSVGVMAEKVCGTAIAAWPAAPVGLVQKWFDIDSATKVAGVYMSRKTDPTPKDIYDMWVMMIYRASHMWDSPWHVASVIENLNKQPIRCLHVKVWHDIVMEYMIEHGDD